VDIPREAEARLRGNVTYNPQTSRKKRKGWEKKKEREKMAYRVPEIEIPKVDIWSAIFDRPSKPFPDSQSPYLSPLPPSPRYLTFRTVIYQNPDTGRHYTFSHLRETTVSFGRGLRRKWAWKKNDVLALFAQNCIDTPAVTWGVHWAGGIVSPANPAYTVRELVHHLKDSGARALFTQKSLLRVAMEAAAEAGIKKECVVLIGDEEERGLGYWREFLVGGEEEGVESKAEIDAEKDLAFLVYSSGTTGLPKGVMLSHYNVVSDMYMVHSSESTFLHWKEDSLLSVLPFYHIYGTSPPPKSSIQVWNEQKLMHEIGLQCLVHFPAFFGLKSIVMTSFDLNKFCRIIQDHKITYTYVAPPVVLHLAKSPVVEKYDLRSLKMITSGAAPLSKELIFRVHERLGTEVKQAYGLSETSPVTHMQVRISPFRLPSLSLLNLSLLNTRTEKMERRPRFQRASPPEPDCQIHVPRRCRSAPRQRRRTLDQRPEHLPRVPQQRSRNQKFHDP